MKPELLPNLLQYAGSGKLSELIQGDFTYIRAEATGNAVNSSLFEEAQRRESYTGRAEKKLYK